MSVIEGIELDLLDDDDDDDDVGGDRLPRLRRHGCGPRARGCKKRKKKEEKERNEGGGEMKE